MNKDEAINLLNDMLLTCNVKEPYTEAVEFAVDSIKNSDRTIDAFVDVTDVLCSHLQTISTMRMSDRLSELEIKVKHGDDMPDGLTQSEQLYYLSMVQLYKLFYSHVYDRSQAKSIKQDIISAYRKNAFEESLIKHHADIRNKYSYVMTEAEKTGCPICQKLVRIFDGREK